MGDIAASWVLHLESLDIHGAFHKMLAKYDVNHRIASPYHPQSSGQV